jgi:hypothetical protein
LWPTITIINRSGADVIVGGHGARDWLHFEITESEGRGSHPSPSVRKIPSGFKRVAP